MSFFTVAARTAWAQVRRGETLLLAPAIALVLISTLLGGASQDNALPLMTVELASLPLLFIAASKLLGQGVSRPAAGPLILMAAVALVPLLQLLPLPAAVWSGLPGRAPAVEAMNVAALGRPALPLSLAPEQTWRSLLALIPPVAMFLGTLLLPARHKRTMVMLWLSLAVVSLFLAALQVFGGSNSPFYFYQITNRGTAVGLFANRNHHAAFVLALLPLAAVFAAQLNLRITDSRILPPALAALYFPVAIVGVAVINSRAGVALLAAALVGSVAIVLRAGDIGRRGRIALAVGGVSVLGVGAVLMFGLGPILDRFGSMTTQHELRFDAWPQVLATAGRYLPLGAGVGAFEPIYRAAEPLQQVNALYFNHAHNDYLELWLETGWLGLVVLLAFFAWFIRAAFIAWTRPAGSEGGALAPAASVVIFLLMAHSAVDYPLRTEAVAVLFAFACGTLAAGDDRKRSV